ncbi:DNA polymerase, partial [Bacillus cereus group sp. BC235]
AELYYDMEVPLSLILARMEHAGIAVNEESLRELSEEYGAKIEEETAAARSLADDPKLNLSSPKQLQKVLFETFDLPKTKKTKTG